MKWDALGRLASIDSFVLGHKVEPFKKFNFAACSVKVDNQNKMLIPIFYVPLSELSRIFSLTSSNQFFKVSFSMLTCTFIFIGLYIWFQQKDRYLFLGLSFEEKTHCGSKSAWCMYIRTPFWYKHTHTCTTYYPSEICGRSLPWIMSSSPPLIPPCIPLLLSLCLSLSLSLSLSRPPSLSLSICKYKTWIIRCCRMSRDSMSSKSWLCVVWPPQCLKRGTIS